MDKFKIGQIVEIITTPSSTALDKSILNIMGNPTTVLGTIIYIGPDTNILIHSNQLEECGLGHSGNNAGVKDFKSPHEKGHWWVFANQIKPYHEQPSLDLDRLFKEENK
jgi:hypothetical protein